MPSLNEQELGNALWAFAKWGRPPPDAWLARFLARLSTCVVGMAPPAICSTLWAAVMLGLKLPAALVDAILLESQARARMFCGGCCPCHCRGVVVSKHSGPGAPPPHPPGTPPGQV